MNRAERRAQRVNIRAILADPEKRKALMVKACIAIQAREGIETSQEQMEAAYEVVRRSIRHRCR